MAESFFKTLKAECLYQHKSAHREQAALIVLVFAEFEKQVDAIVLNFGVSTHAVMDIIMGRETPSDLLPVQMPANMTTVEKQAEDVPFDMDVYIDADGHAYDFGFGLNWAGQTKDERPEKYR